MHVGLEVSSSSLINMLICYTCLVVAVSSVVVGQGDLDFGKMDSDSDFERDESQDPNPFRNRQSDNPLDLFNTNTNDNGFGSSNSNNGFGSSSNNGFGGLDDGGRFGQRPSDNADSGFRESDLDVFRQRPTEDNNNFGLDNNNNNNFGLDNNNNKDNNFGLSETNGFGNAFGASNVLEDGGRVGSGLGTTFINPTNFRPQVDEFGKPLEDIRSVDTTRFELGEAPNADELRCPRNWVRFRDSCYKFTRSPIKRWSDARLICQAYRHQDQDHADLASVSSVEEHRFVEQHLNLIDPQHRRWYLSTRQEEQNQWVNLGDGSQMLNLQDYFLKSHEWGESFVADYKKDYLVYGYSQAESRWGFQPVFGHEEYLFICEMPIEEVTYLMTDERTHEYGRPIGDALFYPMGPFFIRQPNHTVFNVGRRQVVNDLSLRCIAMGWPTPSYRWFMEAYENDTLVANEVDPLKDARVTISGGQLIINDPNPVDDRGKYFCTATNEFGSIRSRSVSIAFGFIGEFILRRSKEVGSENWGKAISCDPPQHFPEVKYYWARDYFPNFVQEDRRVMVSYDGYIYFSALEKIDQGNYSCSVQSAVSNSGRNGPFFQLKVTPHPNYQQLRFPQNFPKAFPEAPVAGQDVRLECIAFGYPVPYYNWTRRNSELPAGSRLTNYNRVLMLPRVRVEDQGEYLCRAYNDKVSITGSVKLSIQSRPVFTISIGDMHVDEKDDVTWTCEAFGIPDVRYEWLRNGRKLATVDEERLPEERGRYEIRDNVLIIRGVQKSRDEGMYQCRAFNELDSAYSSGQLRVLAFAPTFTKNPLEEKTFAAEGGNVTLRCRPEGAPQPAFGWRKDGNRVASGGKYLLFENGNLFIRQVNVADTGVYTCEASNEYGKAESSGRLLVKRGPSFTSGIKPTPRVIAVTGEDVELRCLAEADPLLDMAYTWSLNGLEIRFFEDDEQERILVTLKNALGNRVVDPASVNNGGVYRGLSEHQRLLASSFVDPLTSSYIKGTGNYNKFRRGILDGYLRILNVSYAEAGSYECVVNSAVGRILATSELIIHGPPGPPGGVSAIALTARSGTVVWTDGAIYGSPIVSYRIEGRTNHNATWLLLADRVVGENIGHLGGRAQIHGRRQVVLNDKLSPFAAYQFRVAGYNKLGMGVFSEASPAYNTRPDRPYAAPRRVRGGGGRTGDLTIVWEPLPMQERNAGGVYYRVYYRRIGVDPERDFQQQTLPRGQPDQGLHVVRVQRKYYFTKYEVKVQVFNEMCEEPRCEGPVSEAVVIYSAEDMPQVAPARVGARPFNSTCINVTWSAIPEAREKVRGELIGYRVKYWRQDLNEITESQYLLSRSLKPHALIIGLQPNTYYWTRVMAYNSAGPGPESERFLERTFKLRPQKPPTAVQVYGLNPSTVRVTWRYVAPTVKEEPLIGYRVRIWESDDDISEANDTIVYIGNKLEAIVDDLTPGKTYFLRVLAFSQGGEGKMSSPAWQFQMGDPDALNHANIIYVFNYGLMAIISLTLNFNFNLFR